MNQPRIKRGERHTFYEFKGMGGCFALERYSDGWTWICQLEEHDPIHIPTKSTDKLLLLLKEKEARAT